MTRTFGPDNAIAWVQVRLRGGPRNLLMTTGAYAAVIGLGMIGSVQLLPDRPSQVMSGWALGIMVLQAGVLLLFAPSRVAGAIRSDLTTGIIESHRLMPLLPAQAVVGYILGASSQAVCLAVANLALGCVAAVGAGVSAVHWLGANALLMAFAAFLWVVLALAAFNPRNVGGLLIFLPVAMFMGQGGALGLAPGLAILVTPLLGASVFDMSATLGGVSEGYAMSVAAQVVVGTLCFVAAARKYRRSDVIGFTPTLGLLLLAAWVGMSWVGTLWWDECGRATCTTSGYPRPTSS
jgi:hypothetical protein